MTAAVTKIAAAFLCQKSEVFEIASYQNSPIPYVGGKRAMREIILKSFPLIYRRYIEVFGGGASILFAKHRERFEVYNDFNSDLVNMFRCVKERPMALIKALKFYSIHSRQEFNILLDFLNMNEPDYRYSEEEKEIARELFDEKDAEMIIKILSEKADLYDVERAAAFYKLIRYSYGSAGKSFGGQPVNLSNTLELLQAAAFRLRETVIENKDFESLIKQYDRCESFFYLDPPYVETEGHYLVEFPKTDHVRLYNTLKDIKGKFLLSYNDCEFIKELYKDYMIVEHTRPNSLAHRYDSGSQFKELLIANYDINERRKNEPKQLSLFGEMDYEFNYLQDYRYKRPNHTTVFIPRSLEENR